METDCKTEHVRAPLSPLPNTLRCCPRDDTVCTYCGVSYLVLHEIADLEAKILLLEKNQDGEVEWARGALQAACQALVQRELVNARASAESRIQALAEVYDQERAESREQQRQVLGHARAVWESAHVLALRFLPGHETLEAEATDASPGGARARGAIEYLEHTARVLPGLERALCAAINTAEDLQAALRRARQAETELVQARVQTVGLEEEADRLRREAEETRSRSLALHSRVGEEAARAARHRGRLRLLTGQAELWRGVARSLEEEKVVQERMLAELREQLRQLRVAKVEQASPPDDEGKRRAFVAAGVASENASLKGALRESHEEIASLRGQKLALQTALQRMESNALRSSEERHALAEALQKARQSQAAEAERRAERRVELGAWQEERAWLLAERARAEAESASLRSTCVGLRERAQQCAQQCARMEHTVLRQCEERDALLRALPPAAPHGPLTQPPELPARPGQRLAALNVPAAAELPATSAVTASPTATSTHCQASASIPAALTRPGIHPADDTPARAPRSQPYVSSAASATALADSAKCSLRPSASISAPTVHRPPLLDRGKPAVPRYPVGPVVAPALQVACKAREAFLYALPDAQPSKTLASRTAPTSPAQPGVAEMLFTIDATRPPNARRGGEVKQRIKKKSKK